MKCERPMCDREAEFVLPTRFGSAPRCAEHAAQDASERCPKIPIKESS